MNNTPNHINNLRSPVTHAPAQGARTEHPYALSRPNQPTQDPEDILDMELTQADDAPVDQAAETRSDVGDMSDDLDPKSHYTALQVTALSHLLTSSTIIEAAKRTGCNERTIRKWLADPVYKAEYLRARREAVEHASGNIQSLTELAAEALRRNLTCGILSAELRASNTVMASAYKSLEVLELANRIAALEQNEARRAAHKKRTLRVNLSSRVAIPVPAFLRKNRPFSAPPGSASNHAMRIRPTIATPHQPTVTGMRPRRRPHPCFTVAAAFIPPSHRIPSGFNRWKTATNANARFFPKNRPFPAPVAFSHPSVSAQTDMGAILPSIAQRVGKARLGFAHPGAYSTGGRPQPPALLTGAIQSIE